jgi:hypothetical protein
LDVWVASPPPSGSGDVALGIDGGGIAITRGNPGLFLKGGVGLLVSSDLTGPGLHFGLGLLFESGGLGVRLAGTARAYTPDGGVPVPSLEIGLMRLARREQ